MASRARTADGRSQAFRILLRVETHSAYASVLLRKLPGTMEARERGLANELVLGTLRWQGWLDHALAGFSRREFSRLDGAVRVALRMAAYQILRMDRIPARAAVDESVRLARGAVGRFAAGYVNGVLRALCRDTAELPPDCPDDGVDPLERLSVETSHPTWMVARRIQRLGDVEGRQALLADNEHAAMTVRTNPGACSRAELREALARAGISAEPGRWSPRALRLEGGMPPPELYGRGWFYIQDEASQLVADLVAPDPGEWVLDLCAAPGGKATDLALAEGGSSVVAGDRHLGRLRAVQEQAQRLGGGRLRLLVQDAGLPGLRRGCCSRILVDAPCSGTGTLRRHPEIRWRLREDHLVSLALEQDRILRAAADLLAPGGRIIYSVCSLEPEEGPQRVAALLGERDDLRLLDPRQLPVPIPAELIAETEPGPHLSTWPHLHGVDGFFAAVLRRES